MTSLRSFAQLLPRVAASLALAAVLGAVCASSAFAAGTFTTAPVPLIGGTFAIGHTLTAVTGAWSPQPDSFTYQWFADSVPIDGATSQSYTPTLDYLCLPITVQVTAVKAGYDSANSLSDPTPLIEPIADVGDYLATGSAGVAGTPLVGHTLTATTGAWNPSPDVFGYQWLADGNPVGGATGSTYALTSADLGKKISVAVTGFTQFYNTVTSTSTPTSEVTDVFAVTPVPSITGTPEVGETLSAVTGAWSPTPDSFAYQWYADDVVIPGSVDATYGVTADVAGKHISVRVTPFKANYASVSETSSHTAAVTGVGLSDFVTVPTSSITGTANVGQTLSADHGAWDPAPDSFSYQWLADGDVIPGSTGSTYTATAEVVGKHLSVRVTATKAGYNATSSSSAQTDPVVGVFSATPVPSITGVPLIGQPLTAVAGFWGPTPDSYAYQWFADNVAIVGATGVAYAPTADVAGKKISVRVTAKKAGYISAGLTSGQTALVTGVFTSAPGPKISGTAKVGKTLSAVAGAWSPTAALSYQWYANGKKIAGTTQAKLKLAAGQKGKKITVCVTARKPYYATVTKLSAATAKVK